jgi:hypothetical protein
MTSLRTRTGFRLCGAGLLVVALVAAGGCGKKQAVVTGKVTLKDGRPVTAGTVSFFGDENRVATSQIGPDGSYKILDAPVGEVKITVQGPPQRQAMGGSGAKMPEAPPGLGGMPADKIPEGMSKDPLAPGAIVPVNARYQDPKKTPLSWTVAASVSAQEHDIVLDP